MSSPACASPDPDNAFHINQNIQPASKADR
jgi:hypothetical protein